MLLTISTKKTPKVKGMHLKHLLVTGSLVQRYKRMQVSQLWPADGDHLTGGIQLHGAAAQSNHGVRQRQVLVLQPLQVPQHLMLAVVQVEDFVLQKRCGTLEVAYTCLHLYTHPQAACQLKAFVVPLHASHL